VKFPDPPLLSDGDATTFEQWRDGFEDKIRANMDYYAAATQQDTQANIVAYMRTRTEGNAQRYLSTLIRAAQKDGQQLDYQYFLDRLEKAYGDPHRQLNARREFQNLRLRHPAEFATFQGNFFRLAHERELPKDQWVEEFHEKLPDSLRTAMGTNRRQFRDQYDAYVDIARDFARELAISDSTQATRTRASARAPVQLTSVRTPRPAPVAAPKPTAVPAATSSTICYNCRRTGHYRQDCPYAPAESKAVEELDPYVVSDAEDLALEPQSIKSEKESP
jgi:hypothetical protein